MTHLRTLTLVMLLSAGGYAVWIFASGFDEVMSGVAKIGFGGMMILLLLSLANYFLRFLRWHWMLFRVTGKAIPMRKHLLCYLSGFALTATPGKLGEAVRSIYLKPHGVRMSESVAALFAERLIDLISVLIIAALALVRFPEYRMVGLGLLVAVLIVAACIRSRRLLLWFEGHFTFKENSSSKLAKLVRNLFVTLHAASLFMRWSIWIPGIVLGVVAWGAEAWGFVLLLEWLTGERSVAMAAGIYALGMVAGAISFLPGGIGGAEVAMAGMLMATGVSLADATTATIICRAVTLWFAVLLGLAVLGRFQVMGNRNLEISRDL